MNYLENIFISFDQFINAVLNGAPDETLSARAFRVEQSGKLFGKIFRPIIDCIFFWQKSHCESAYLSELSRKQFPLDYKYPI